MPSMRLILDGDNCWPDLKERREQVVHITDPIQAALLLGGMASGKPSVALRLELPDGRTVIAETSLELFAAAGRAFVARSEVPDGDQHKH